ncbi:MAG: amino acid adenylation domain-containing protein [Colwellia sp.]|nr:amino acid adenylation domain-containing protein [Colwellia sp.]
MIAKEIIYSLHQRSIVIQNDGEELLLTGDTDALTERDIVLLKENKAELLMILEEKNRPEFLFESKVTSDSYEAPASNLQRNIYFLESLSEGKSFYNVPTAFRLTGEIDEHTLEKSIASLCKKFHILRTVYQYLGDELKQIIEPFDIKKVPFEVALVDADKIEQRLKDEANHCFDLATQWPIRAVLFKSGAEQILSLNMHHIAIDGYSAKLITGALSEAYQSYHSSNQKNDLSCEGKGDVFSAPQYADYAFWHQDYLGSNACQQASEYWGKLLKDAPSCHNFPLEFARPSTLSVEGDVVYHDIKGASFAKIKQTAQQNNTSVFLLLQSLFAGFMARFGDEEDLVISSVYANRTPSAFMNTIGMFANTIPFRYRLDESTDIGHLVNSTRTQHNQALQYQQFPFEMMLEGLTIERDPSYNPLVQVQFVLQEDSLSDFTLNDLDVEIVSNRQAVAKFDFSVHIFVNQDNIKIQWEFNTNLFSKERLETILTHFLAFIDHHVEHEFSKVLLYKFDGHSAVNEVRKSNFNAYISNPELIEQYATSQPQAVAVKDGEKRLNYRQLVQNANKFIAGLQQSGVKFGDRVAVYMDKSIEQVIAMYAVMRAGYTYVPLDPSYPQERLSYICQNAAAKALVHAADSVPSENIAGEIPLAAFETLISCDNVPELGILSEQQPAYIIYTSGSTGKPKGVVVPHGSIYYSLQANRKVYDFLPQDIMPTVGSQAFGVSLLETFVPLISGGTVQTLRKSEVADIIKLIDTTQDVTVMHMVPSLMAQWLDQIENNPALYTQLRLLLVGAEPVPPILLTRLKAWREDVVVRVLYGMTESSVVSSGYLSNEHDGRGYSVGKPHPNMRFYTMNRFGVPQPVGVAGELYVGGLSLASGYVDLPELTDDKFIHHKHLNERLYKTGDRARLMASGHFEFLGRVDHQVSLRGIRIETGEIESLVNQINAIKKCIAHVVPLDNGDSKFVLYYTIYGDVAKPVIEASIRAVLTKDIPESMRPSIFVQLEGFPHNPNGKVDRKKLPKPTSDSDYVSPSTDIEKYLHDLWCTMLELDQVSILDNFFELGGHSLMATKLINKINEQYGISLPLRRFFEAANIKGCAIVIHEEVDKHQLSQLLVKSESADVKGEIDEFVI